MSSVLESLDFLKEDISGRLRHIVNSSAVFELGPKLSLSFFKEHYRLLVSMHTIYTDARLRGRSVPKLFT